MGSNAYVINAGTISGGDSNAQAVTIVGNNNIFEIWSTSQITGNVVAASNTEGNTFALGGNDNGSFDASDIGSLYQGFQSFQKSGDSTWTLTGTPGQVTPWTINQGTLSVSSDDALGDPAGALTFNGGTLQTTAPFSSTRAVTVNVGGGTFETNADLTSSGPISGPGALTKSGPGVLTLSGPNTFSGGLTVAAGTARAGIADQAFGSGLLTVDVGAFADLADFNETVGGLAGAGDVLLGSGTLTTNQMIDTEFSGVISGSGGLTKNGPSTLDLTGTNTYTGPTTVNGGTLAVNGSIVSATTVNTGGTLGGNGTIFNGVDNFGIVAPGNSIGALTITGAYVGHGGTLQIESVLAGSGSPTDQLILSGAGASASGTTNVAVINLNGPGALTTGNGIPIVLATGGATTSAGAFTLPAPVAAGPFQYLLFRGPTSGGTADEQNTWFLRSHFGSNTPYYRPEASIYGALPGMARSLAIATVSTFHERYGDQDAVRGGNGRAWGRVFGEHNDQNASGHLDTRFEGWLGGVQLGIDAFRLRGDDGSQDAGGFFFTLAKADGDVNGHAIGVPNAYAGASDLAGPSFGAYLTHIGPGNWYLDGLAMLTFYEADGTSTNRVATNVGGSGGFLSLEAGMPVPLGMGVTLEPQGQLIYQRIDFGGLTDAFSTVAFDTADVLTGRLGLRLAGAFGPAWRPYLKANIWQDWAGEDRTTYANTHVLSSTDDSTALEVGGGLVGALSDTLSIWAVADYTTDVADNDIEIIRGNVGVKVGW